MNYLPLHLTSKPTIPISFLSPPNSSVKKQMKRPDGALINPEWNETATTESSWKKESPRSRRSEAPLCRTWRICSHNEKM